MIETRKAANPRSFVLLAGFFLLSIFQIEAQSSFDFVTTTQDGGGLTEGHLELQKGFLKGIRMDYREETRTTLSEIPDAELSTLNSTELRRDFTLLMPFEIPLLLIQRVYLGMNILHLKEHQEGTFVNRDEAGEYGSRYTHDRTSSFYSPRIGFSLGTKRDKGSSTLFRWVYDAQVSPVYYLDMKQNMRFAEYNYEETIPNALGTWSSPYFNHSLALHLGNWLTASVYHSFMNLTFSSLFEDPQDNNQLKAFDDPTLINTLHISLDLALQLIDRISLSVGLGYQWTWMERSGTHVPEDARASITNRHYIRIGARLAPGM